MKTTLFMATSVNGIIARRDGDEDWLSDVNWRTFKGLLKEHKNLIWGRKTYEAAQNWGENYINDLKGIELVIVTKTPQKSNDPHITYCHSPQEALKILEDKGFKSALLSGGSTLNTSFVEACLVNEIIININSVVLASGIPLFSLSDFELKLKLIQTKELSSDIFQLHYSVAEQLKDKSAQ